MATLTSLNTGYCRQLAGVALKGSGLHLCRFPARAYLLQAQGRYWLWDTGYAPHFHAATASGVFALYARVTPVHSAPAQAASAQLAAMGIAPSDLAGVVLSHFHADHIAGLADFPDVNLYCCGGGWQALSRLRGLRALRHGFVPSLLPADFEQRLTCVQALESVSLPQALAPFASAYAVPGAGGEILVVELPGHAAGHLGAFVQTEQGWVLLATDAAWAHASYKRLVPPSALARLVLHDRAAYMQTLDKLHQLYQRDVIRIVLTHEGVL